MRLSLPVSLAVMLALCLSACQTTETHRPVVADMPVRQAAPARAWHVLFTGEVAGEVIFYEADVVPADSVYVVRNLYAQDLGLIDSLGRAYRFLPHLDDPVWVGTGTIGVGAQRILESDEPCELVEFPLPAPERRQAAL